MKVNAAYANRDQPVPEVVITWLVEGQLFESQPMAGSYVPVLRTGQISVYARKPAEGF